MSLQKLWKSLFLVKWKFPCRFTNEETRFISFKDLSCFVRSKRFFRQYVKFHAFSILATQLTRWAVRIQLVWNFSWALTQNGLIYEYIISIAKALLNIKTEVFFKICFAKHILMNICYVLSISGESREVTCSFSIILKKPFWSRSLLKQLLFRYFSRILPRF